MEKHDWTRNPFVDNENAAQEFTSLKVKNPIGLSLDLTLKSLYNPNSLISFCIKDRAQFSLVGCKTLLVLESFVPSYVCSRYFKSK